MIETVTLCDVIEQLLLSVTVTELALVDPLLTTVPRTANAYCQAAAALVGVAVTAIEAVLVVKS